MREVVERHRLRERIRLEHEAEAMRWDTETSRWEIETNRGRLTADVVVSAVGALADPSIPELPGLERFEGTTFHSARWNHEHDLHGRDVAVIGTGASAIQFVPEIQPLVSRLHLFQRSGPWVMPSIDPKIPQRVQRAFERHPRLLGAVRHAIFSLLETFHVGFRHPALMRFSQRRARRHIERQVADPAIREKVTPNYTLGCKRVLNSNSWYPAICADNVELITAGIGEVTDRGIVDRDGNEHSVDTIIFGTGFQVADPPVSHRVVGREGLTLSETWQGSPKAYLGLTVSGFPNLFILLGPNTGLGHNSVLLMIEAQVSYLVQALRYRQKHRGATLEPDADVQARYVEQLDRATHGTVWTAGGCTSWYLDSTGRNSVLWPGTVRAYQRRLARFDPADYRIAVPARRRVRELVPA
jgi:cation diffusion facilitator CzcD-associated flavoprotein CzcO